MRDDNTGQAIRQCCFIDLPSNAGGAIELAAEAIRAASYFVDDSGLDLTQLCSVVAPDLTASQLGDLVSWVARFFPKEGDVSDVHDWFIKSTLVELQRQAFSPTAWKDWTIIERSWKPREIHLTLTQVKGDSLNPRVAFRDVVSCSVRHTRHGATEDSSEEELMMEEGAALASDLRIARILLNAFIVGEGHDIWAKLDTWHASDVPARV